MLMPLKLPKPRLRLRSLIILVALLAVSMWAGLNIWSPTRRLGRLLRADQPVYIRRDAASALGHQIRLQRGFIPSWEIERAVSILIDACDDPSPRVREYAALGLAQLETRVDRAIPKLIALLNDQDRFVRYSAAGALGFVVDLESPRRAEVVTALVRTLGDSDSDVGLSAAEALTKLGSGKEAAGVLMNAFSGKNEYLRGRARLIIGRPGTDPRPFLAGFVAEMREKDERRRNEALSALQHIASPDVVRSALVHAAEADDTDIRQWAKASQERLEAPR
jgi:HEAT repeat protein